MTVSSHSSTDSLPACLAAHWSMHARPGPLSCVQTGLFLQHCSIATTTMAMHDKVGASMGLLPAGAASTRPTMVCRQRGIHKAGSSTTPSPTLPTYLPGWAWTQAEAGFFFLRSAACMQAPLQAAAAAAAAVQHVRRALSTLQQTIKAVS